MAYGTEYYARFKDFTQDITYRVLIQKLDYVSSQTEITYLADEPLTGISRGDKTKLQSVIQGTEVVFNFFAVPADSDKYDSIFESAYKDYRIVIQDYTVPATPVDLGTYWLKPDNLSRDFVNRVYQISLSATDSLADLKSLYFGSISDTKYTILEVVKLCLELTGLDLDIKVQLGTFETTYMTSVQCALKEASIDSRRFYKVTNGETKYLSGYDILTEALKSFNCTIKQEGNYWYIKNPHELNSYVFEYDYATLTQQSRTATSIIVDIDAMKVERNGSLNKIPPINGLKVTHRNKDVGGDLIADLADWEGTAWEAFTFDYTFEGTNDEIITVSPVPPWESSYVLTTTAFNASYINGNEYVKVTLEGWLRAEVGGYQVPDFMTIEYRLFNSSDTQIAYESGGISSGAMWFSDNTPTSGNWKIPSGGLTNHYIELTISGMSSDADLYKLKNLHITSVSIIDGDATDAVVFDKAYYFKNTNIDYPNQLEVESLYGDTEEITHLGGIFVNSAANTSTEWRRYGKTSTDDTPILFQYAKNVLNNQQRFKDYINITVYNPTRTIGPNTIIETATRYYLINKFEKSYRRNFLRLEIIELLTADSTQDTPTQLDLTTVDGVPTQADNYVNTAPAAEHSDLTGLGDDDHTQYHNDTRGDARYSLTSHTHTAYAGIAESETISGLWNYTTAPTVGGVSISLAGHSHSYDNYGSWQIKIADELADSVTTGHEISFIEGTGITLTRGSGSGYYSMTIAASAGTSYSGTSPIDVTGSVISLLWDSTMFEQNLSEELKVKDNYYAAYSHSHTTYAGIAESETISGSWNFTTAPTISGTAISLVGHTHTTYAENAQDESISGDWTFTGFLNAFQVNLDSTPTVNTASAITASFTAGVALVAGDVCYMDSSGYMQKADANATTFYPAWAMAAAAISQYASGKFVIGGIAYFSVFPTMTRGGIVYLSTTAGDITTTQPTTTGDQVQILGRCLNTDTIHFNPSPDWFTYST